MAKFKGATLQCKRCGSAFRVPPSRAATAEYCSIECASFGRAEKMKKRVMLTCEFCGGAYESVDCQADRRRFCSNLCRFRSHDYKAEQRAAATGEKNPSWRGGRTVHSDGYIYLKAQAHPFASNGYVLEHRLVMEAWLRANDPLSPHLVKLGNHLYLSPEVVVHHKDEDRKNNKPGNLECMTPSDHSQHHNKVRRA